MPISVLVADGSRARILTAPDIASPLQEEQDLAHPESRLREQDLVAGGSGRASDPVGLGKHSVGNEKSAHKLEIENFAREICAELDKLRQQDKLHRLYLVAGPEFLGLLRANLSKQCAEIVAGEIGKNLVTQSIDNIRAQLPKRL